MFPQTLFGTFADVIMKSFYAFIKLQASKKDIFKSTISCMYKFMFYFFSLVLIVQVGEFGASRPIKTTQH